MFWPTNCTIYRCHGQTQRYLKRSRHMCHSFTDQCETCLTYVFMWLCSAKYRTYKNVENTTNKIKSINFKRHELVPWPSWLRHRANNAGISGSIPLGTTFCFLPFFLLHASAWHQGAPLTEHPPLWVNLYQQPLSQCPLLWSIDAPSVQLFYGVLQVWRWGKTKLI